VLALTGAVLSYLAMQFYRAYMSESNWRSVYVLTTVISCVFTTMQLLLVFDAAHQLCQSHTQRL
jgi:uncharacterized membrane protein